MRKTVLIAFLCFFAADPLSACITCNKAVQEGIYNSQFYPNLLVMLSAFIVLALIVLVLARMSSRHHQRMALSSPGLKIKNPVPLLTAAMVLGIGLGGFADGILLHQVLQWHEMLSNKIPVDTVAGKSVNMFWDGIFHLFCLLVTLLGVILLWKLLRRDDIDRSGKLLCAGLIGGWGLFNIVEGIIDHQLLKLHNVKESSPEPEMWNLGFLGLSVLMILAAGILYKSREQR